VKEALQQRSWVRDITGALTVPVLCDYVLLWERVEHVVLQPGVPDRFVWIWTANGKYSASSAYCSFFLGRTPLVGASHLWRAAAPAKVKFFFWVGLHNRLWTADRRRRHGLQQEAACALCQQEDETTDHLLCSCVFAREVWHLLLLPVGLQHLAPEHGANLRDWWQLSRASLPEELRRSYDSAVLLVTWSIWKERNRRTFDHVSKTPLQLLHLILEEANAWMAAGFALLSSLLAAAGNPARSDVKPATTHRRDNCKLVQPSAAPPCGDLCLCLPAR
jgi:hypothetical protein